MTTPYHPARYTAAPASRLRQPVSHSFYQAAYNLLLFTTTIAGILYGFVFSEVFFPSYGPAWLESTLNFLKLFWLIPLPYAIMNVYSFLRYPVFVQPAAPAYEALPGVRLFFRIVTRGNNPRLVAENVYHLEQVLRSALPDHTWVIEIVTDNELTIDNFNTHVIVVPSDYKTARGTRYKGRALHYALQASAARAQDWIIHLDEETHFDAHTALSIHHFVVQQHHEMAAGRHRWGKIGQGVILYGKHRVTNWITTLADSIRVGDDYGRFRLQYEHGKAYFGLHGSFIVIHNALEQHVGFDHGPMSSITEDAYFALLAQAAGGRFAFIHAFMYEQSPFSVRDYIKQRRRWFGGLWLCVLSPEIPLRQRLILGTFMVLWSVSWLCLAMVYINFLYPTGTAVWVAMCGGVSFLYYVTLYLIGFLRTYDRHTLGLRYYALLVAQIALIPLFSMMESAGVIYGLISPPRDFYIVQKES